MFRQLATVAGREVSVDGRAYLFFGGTAYLGLNTHAPFVDLFKEGVDRFGVNNGSSRGNNVQLGIYPQAEEAAAARFGAADAMVVSSGFLAAQLAVRHLAEQYDELCYAPGSHPALWVHGEPNGADGSFALWQRRLVDHINASDKSSFLIVSNTLDTLVPARYDFAAFSQIREDKRVHFLLDDSHGIGVLDSGTAHGLPAGGHVRTTVVASLAKGLGVDAGLILSDGDTIASLRTTQAFRGASPPSPAAMYAFVHGEGIYRERLARLCENVALFAQGSAALGLQSVAGFPVFYSADQSLFDRLAELGILISSFPYPSPADPLYNRIVISAAHTSADIERLVEAMG